MEGSATLSAGKRKEADKSALMEDGFESHKRLKRQLTQESDIKKKRDVTDDWIRSRIARLDLVPCIRSVVYEANIHEMMKSLPDQRKRRKQDFERVLTLFSSDSHARDRRNKVFVFFNEKVTKASSYQTEEVFTVSQELLSVLDEARENLELLVSWCDLCLPANEQAFAEAHRIKIQEFQEYLATGLQIVVSAMADINTQLEKRAETLRSLFTTKDVLEENHEGWCRMHRDMLVHNETNAYLHVSKTWEKVLEGVWSHEAEYGGAPSFEQEIQYPFMYFGVILSAENGVDPQRGAVVPFHATEDYLLYYNYWKTNLKDNAIVFSSDGKAGNGDYFG